MTDIAAVRDLLAAHWYDAAAATLERLVPQLGAPAELVYASRLARVARRALDLDAEDFATLSRDFQTSWAARLASAAFPVQPRDVERGALRSMVGLFELMLEVIDIRSGRDEPLQVVLTAHLIGEYLPQLAWESTLATAVTRCCWRCRSRAVGGAVTTRRARTRPICAAPPTEP